MAYHSGNRFSTKDSDNDEYSSGSRAGSHHGAWWYGYCHNSNLNGEYLGQETNSRGISWYTWKNTHYSLQQAEMKIRPE